MYKAIGVVHSSCRVLSAPLALCVCGLMAVWCARESQTLIGGMWYSRPRLVLEHLAMCTEVRFPPHQEPDSQDEHLVLAA